MRIAALGRRAATAIDHAVARARDLGANLELVAGDTQAIPGSDIVLAMTWPSGGESLMPALAAMAAAKPVVVYEVEATAGKPAEFFSYDGQCRLVRLILPAVQVPEGCVADDPGASLCEQLLAAQEAELRGDLRHKATKLKSYRSLVEAHAGKNISFRDVKTLITLSKTL